MVDSVDNSVACLVGLLSGSEPSLQLDAAWCLTNMAAGTDEHALVVIKHAGAYLVTYLSSGNTPMQVFASLYITRIVVVQAITFAWISYFYISINIKQFL